MGDVRLVPLTQSRFLNPMRLEYSQAGRAKVWDLMWCHSSVAIVIFNTDTQKFIFVQQFRPAVYVSRAAKLTGNLLNPGDSIDTDSVPGKIGITLELCAGIIDKNLSEIEIAREEVKEECGYHAPLEAFTKIITFPASVGASGGTQTLFCVEVGEKDKVGPGGGLVEEGEMINVVEMTVSEAKEYISRDQVDSPIGLLFGIQWYLQNRLSTK